MLRFVVLSVALAGPEIILAVVREVTRIEKGSSIVINTVIVTAGTFEP